MSVIEQTSGLSTNGRALPWTNRLPVTATIAPDTSRWLCGQDRSFAMVQAALQTLARTGEPWTPLPVAENPLLWAREAARRVSSAECNAVVLFCEDPALAACIANKTHGVRAAAVSTVHQAARATLSMAANLLAVEMPGRTFFEIRYILHILRSSQLGCPDEVKHLLRQMEGSCASSK
jgi:hypothetical protein